MYLCVQYFHARDPHTVTSVYACGDNIEDNMEESDDDMPVSHDSSVDDNINENKRLVTDEDLFENDLLDNFLLNVEDSDIHCDGENEFDEEYLFLDEIPTTDASDDAFLVNEVTDYGGTLGETVISGHVVLNQCRTLLT